MRNHDIDMTMVDSGGVFPIIGWLRFGVAG